MIPLHSMILSKHQTNFWHPIVELTVFFSPDVRVLCNSCLDFFRHVLADTDALLPTRFTSEIVFCFLLPDNDAPLRFIRFTSDVVLQHVPLDSDAPWFTLILSQRLGRSLKALGGRGYVWEQARIASWMCQQQRKLKTFRRQLRNSSAYKWKKRESGNENQRDTGKERRKDG